MPVFRKDGLNVLFVHVPKAGGSAVERAFIDDGWNALYRDPRARKDSPNAFRHCSPQHMHREMLGAILKLDAFDAVFMTVRDPLARFRSEYAMRNPTLEAATVAGVEEWFERTVRTYATNPFVHDNHLRPQAEFLLPHAHVYRLEDGLDAAMADLNRRHDLGAPVEVPRVMERQERSGFKSSEVPISPDLERRLRRMYAADFDLFGYR